MTSAASARLWSRFSVVRLHRWRWHSSAHLTPQARAHNSSRWRAGRFHNSIASLSRSSIAAGDGRALDTLRVAAIAKRSHESSPTRRCACRQDVCRRFVAADPTCQRPVQDAPPSPASLPCHRHQHCRGLACRCNLPYRSDLKISAMNSLGLPLPLPDERNFPIMHHGLSTMTRKDQLASPLRIVKTTTRTDRQ